MRKKFLKNVAILAFALFGLGIIGNNVMYGTNELIVDPGDGGGGSSYTCYHTWKGTWIGGWHIIDCFTCTQKRVSEFRDRGRCTI